MILKFVKQHLKLLGILYPQDNPSSRNVVLSYLRNCFVFISLGFFTIPTFGSFLFEAITFADYVNSFFFTLCGVLGISFNALLIWKKTNVNQLIADLEAIIILRRNC